MGQTETVRIPKFPTEFDLEEDEVIHEEGWEDFEAEFEGMVAEIRHVTRHCEDDNGKWILGVELRCIDAGLRGWSNEHCRQPALPLHEIMTAFSKVEALIAKYELSRRDPVMIVAPYVSY
jgi:hypothetical protein